MSRRWISRGSNAARALAVLAAFGCCLGAVVAYAAARPQSSGDSPPRQAQRPPLPSLTDHPDPMTTDATARFAFSTPRRGLRFQCRLDRARWSGCSSPLTVRRLTPGEHRFEVRALDGSGQRGAAARFGWKVVEATPVPAAPVRPKSVEAPPSPAVPIPVEPTPGESKPLEIEAELSGLGPLYPGAPAQTLPLALSNPNRIPIFVTGLQVAVNADPAGCDSASNLELIPSNASPTAPLAIPAESTVSLPAEGIAPPAIAMRDLPVNQDACQGAEFPLVFSGEAHE